MRGDTFAGHQCGASSPSQGRIASREDVDWNNLFLSCPHCNNVKAKPKHDEGIIDCCVRDPEALPEQRLAENEVRVSVLVEDDREASLMAELIGEVFMSDNPPMLRAKVPRRLSRAGFLRGA